MALSQAVSTGGPGNVVYSASFGLLGVFGGVMAFLGVVILPITSGDTAFRSSRLILAEYFNMEQKTLSNRLVIAVPLFIIGGILTQIDFGVIWRYFGFANQTTAVMMLWTASAYLVRQNKLHWVTTIPAIFMTTVVISFILNSSTLGLGLAIDISTAVGLICSVMTTLYITKLPKKTQPDDGEESDTETEKLA